MIRFIAALFALVAVAVGVLWMRSYWPADIEAASVACADDAPAWPAEEPLKVMSYNVQYMAGKNYVFFYDVDINNPEHVIAVEKAGKAIASVPSIEDTFRTLDQVAGLIAEEAPDIVMLQEVSGRDDSRTHYKDHTGELLSRLPPGSYPCRTEAPYWKAEFIFHPDVLGPVDMKLVTLSRYRITQSQRHQLPRKPRNFLMQPFHFQRALLESHVETDSKRSIALINTHFDAWGAGTGIMEQQIASTKKVLKSLDQAGVPWVLGGDLNLLPPDDNRQRARILAAGTGNYDENPQLAPLYEKYRGIPPIESLLSENPEPWYTHYPNNPLASAPDRTIDYLFFSDQWALADAYVMQGDALQVSDHLPVVGVYSLPAAMPPLQPAESDIGAAFQQ